MRISGKHTEDHHLIRCLAPEKDDGVSSSIERHLISLEDRIDSMQSRFDERLISREDRIDNIQSRFDDLTGRIGNIEQLLQRIATASEAQRS